MRLQANLNKCFQGVIPLVKGFIVTDQQVKDWIKVDSKNQEVLKLFSMGVNLAKNINGIPTRWLIDFNDMNIEEASNYRLPFEYVKATVLHQYRTQQMDIKWCGITTLYNNFFDEPTSQLYKLHQQLDKLVMQAYSFSYNDDILEKLLELNLELAEKEKQGKSVIGPWTPV